ncbi:MAG: hypothetical protein ACYC6C_06160 [Coriobacteriia bacterium]
MSHIQIIASLNDIAAATTAGYPRNEIKDAVEDLLIMIQAHIEDEGLVASSSLRRSPDPQPMHDSLAREFSSQVAACLTEWDYPVEPVLDCARAWLEGHMRNFHTI